MDGMKKKKKKKKQKPNYAIIRPMWKESEIDHVPRRLNII